jgi:dTDP-4-amino-4,6-dideoxygalactose transaminase
MMIEIPFNRPSLVGREMLYIDQAIANGHISGDGPFTRKCHAYFEQTLGVTKALLTTSCTDALEMAALLLDIQAGDEIIVPAFTFVSTINAFVLRGARPVFIDIRLDTLNMDESRLEQLVTPRTKAIVVMHYAGVGCEMDSVLEIAGRYGLPVVEDNAHGLFGRYQGKSLGTLGSLSAQSFHETKNVTCGEGGALFINEARYVERAEVIREKGTNRSSFFRGEISKYSWVDVGSSYLPSDLLAAFLFGQLEASAQIQSKRQRLWTYYNTRLSDWAKAKGVRLPIVPPHCSQAYHMFYLILPSLEQRQNLIAHLMAHGILAVFHYLPLHLSEMGRRFGGQAGDFPVTEMVSNRLLRLPFYYDLSEAEQARVVETIEAYRLTPG